jgi:hypothetical protein
MTRTRFLRRVAGWLLVTAALVWLQTASGQRAYDGLLATTDAPAVRQARADSIAAVANARAEARSRGDSIAAIVVSPPLSRRTLQSQRAELFWLGALGLPIALLGLGLDVTRYRVANRDAAR